jgi:hypothetical protein
MIRPSRCSLHQGEFTFGEHPRKPTLLLQNALFQQVQYSVGPIVTLHGPITAREYVNRLGNQVQPMIQTLFPNDSVFHDYNVPFTQLELFSHGLKSMKVNFNIFRGQRNHQI